MPKPWYAETLEWDAENETHLGDHGVSASEVEDVFSSKATWLPNRKGRSGDWKMVGRTRGGRALTVILTWNESAMNLRPITGYDSSKSDITRYLKGKP